MDPQRSSHDSKSTACEALLSSCKELEVLIPKVSSTEAIKHANRSLRSVISLLKGTLQVDSVMPLTPTSSYAASSNHQKQLRFYSTKKKAGKRTNRWSKPTLQEESSICDKLSSLPVKLCSVCCEEDDGCSEAPCVDWIECRQCNMWVHLTCSASITAGEPLASC